MIVCRAPVILDQVADNSDGGVIVVKIKDLVRHAEAHHLEDTIRAIGMEKANSSAFSSTPRSTEAPKY